MDVVDLDDNLFCVGALVRPGLEEVITAVSAEVGMEPWKFDHQPRKRKAVLTR